LLRALAHGAVKNGRNMKKAILLFFALLPLLASATIDPDGDFTIVTGTKITYASTCTVECYPKYSPDLDIIEVDVRVYDGGTQIAGTTLYFAAAHVASYTGTGSGEVEQFQNVVEQAVADYLGSLSENSGITFTIT
jgi:hypothetical protein